MENVTVRGTKKERREQRAEDKAERNSKKALRNRALADRIRSENEVHEASRKYVFKFGEDRIEVNPYEVAKVVAITGTVVLALVVTAYLVKTGVEWLIRYIMADGTAIDQPISDDVAAEMM